MKSPVRHLPAMAKILIAHDFSPFGESAFDAGVRLAKDLGAGVVLVHAFQPPGPAMGVAGAPRTHDQQRAAAVLQYDGAVRLTSEWAERARGEGVDVETVAEEAEPADLVGRTAKAKDVAIVVVGTHGRTGLKRAVLGSVAESIVRQSDRPVLVVPRPAGS